MYGAAQARVTATLAEIEAAGLTKHERELTSPQAAHIDTAAGQALNFCANNYLGLADHPDVVAAAVEGLREWGFGMASVRFICGTQELHKRLEHAVSDFLGTEDTILFSSCFDANGGVFEVLFGEEDAIISDALNHASLIDGIRLSKAARFRYQNADMADLEEQLVAARGARTRCIVTDGVFSMDGYLAPLDRICDLAEKYDALVLVDDSHAVGFVGPGGRGTPDHFGVRDRVDLLTGTLGKALGGASGGYTAARREIVELLRQRSRPYLFSNTLAPCIAAASLEVLALLQSDEGALLRNTVRANGERFRSAMSALGFNLVPGRHPIIPVMLGDAVLATRMADALLDEGIYVIGFSYPVVPRAKARIRTQMSAAHTAEQIDRAVAAFAKVGRQLHAIR
jgi:glycine C-acetyltransferase